MANNYKNLAPDLAREAFGRGTEFIDIRERNEFSRSRIPGARLLPMSELNQRLNELPKDKEAVVYCHTGERSSYLLAILSSHGYENLINLEGGIARWNEFGHPIESEAVTS